MIDFYRTCILYNDKQTKPLMKYIFTIFDGCVYAIGYDYD